MHTLLLGDKVHHSKEEKATLCKHKGMFLAAIGIEFENVKHCDTGLPLKVEIEEPHKFGMYRSKEEALYKRHRE